MNSIKTLIIGRPQMRTALSLSLADLGITAKESGSLPTTQEMKILSPQLTLIDVTLLGTCDPPWESMFDLLDPGTEPAIIVLTHSCENLVSTNEQKQFNILAFPYTAEALFHSIHQALFIQETVTHRKLVTHQLTLIHHSLIDLFAKLDNMKNIAVTESDHVPASTTETNKIMRKMRPLLVSLLQDARQSGPLHPYQTQLQLLERYISEFDTEYCNQNIQQSIARLLSQHSLSQKELKVVSMIASGLTTEEISDLIHISYDTVKCHRRNIRKKLNLVGKKYTLEEYIQYVMESNSGKNDPDITLPNNTRKRAGTSTLFGAQNYIDFC